MKYISPHSSETSGTFVGHSASSETGVSSSVNETKCSETEVRFVGQNDQFPSKDVRYWKTEVKISKDHTNEPNGVIKEKVYEMQTSIEFH